MTSNRPAVKRRIKKGGLRLTLNSCFLIIIAKNKNNTVNNLDIKTVKNQPMVRDGIVNKKIKMPQQNIATSPSFTPGRIFNFFILKSSFMSIEISTIQLIIKMIAIIWLDCGFSFKNIKLKITVIKIAEPPIGLTREICPFLKPLKKAR